MKTTQFTLVVTLLAGGLAFAGTDYKKMVVTPEPVCGPWYVSAYGGGSLFDDAEYTRSPRFGNALGLQDASLNVDNGWMVGGAVGLRVNDKWRFEVDGNYSEGPLGSLTGRSWINVGVLAVVPALTNVSGNLAGEIERRSLMVNAVREFSALQVLGLTPYLGAGVGLTNVNLDFVSGFQADENVLGYQFMGGLVTNLTDCLQAYLEYRLAGQGELEDVTTFTLQSGSMDAGWAQHVILGVRWFF